jgi:hypothetical protein
MEKNKQSKVNHFKNDYIEFNYIRSQRMFPAIKEKYGKSIVVLMMEDFTNYEVLTFAVYQCYLRACKLEGKEAILTLENFLDYMDDTEVTECVNSIGIMEAGE